MSPRAEAELAGVLRVVANEKCPLMILGGGANVLVRDGGVRGVVVGLSRLVRPCYTDGTRLVVAGGVRLAQASRAAAKAELSGLEFACGIPGTIGGAVWMNAGAYGGEMQQIVTEVTALTRAGERVVYAGDQLHFAYRHSVFQETGDIITQVTMELQPGNAAEIRAKMADYTQRRTTKQPLDMPSSGSTFKRPVGYYAGTLIETTGLKGLTVGGAQISMRHAGFIVNRGGATAADVLGLIAEVQRRVFAEHGVTLEPEVQIFGEDKQRSETDDAY